MVQFAIPTMVSRTMEEYVILALKSYVTTTSSFNLWMSRSRHNTFALVINFINSYWVPCHVKVGLFEAIDTIGVVMVMQVRDLLASYNLLKKLVVYVKDEGGNMSTLARALILVVSCTPLTLLVPW
jgi:hypothetical protein